MHDDDHGLPTYGVVDDGLGTWAELPTLGQGMARARMRRGKYKVRFANKSRKHDARLAQTVFNFD